MTRRRISILAALAWSCVVLSCGGDVESTQTGSGGTTHAGGNGGMTPTGGSSGVAGSGGTDAGNDAGAAGTTSCAPGMKQCNGGCVAVDDPSYGCTLTGCQACKPSYYC